eukprot:CAMPEP_0114134764 /NCGR_PEP_ID=MMETSP0043_2-20121206/14347_1 /TAXON_ID=464988 /ORGANISM="Hemiselmis andersenii, Strain CCMP644" /LENGTH=255 /DNA_ID=CAMNT_0001228457 /DNA_START=50 /DNA_END=817 /DNA_ORIENTATION=-
MATFNSAGSSALSDSDDGLSRNTTAQLSGAVTPPSQQNSDKDVNKKAPGSSQRQGQQGGGQRPAAQSAWGALCCLPFFSSSAPDPNNFVAEPEPIQGPSPTSALKSPHRLASGSLERNDSERFGSSGVGATWYRKMQEANLKDDLIDGLQGETNEETEFRMRRAFESTDTDNSGGIDAEELHAALHRIDIKATKEEARNMVKEADTDGNGTIEYAEFRQMVLRLMVQQNSIACTCPAGELCSCGAAHPVEGIAAA